jgi:uncharacterized protein YjaG (DUF416 family)
MDGEIDLAIGNFFGKQNQKDVRKIIEKEFFGEQPVGTSIIVFTENDEYRFLAHTPTMNYIDFVKAFRDKVQTLSHHECLKLSVSICNKLYPDYVQFVDSKKWGDKELLGEAIQICEKGQHNQIDLGLLKEKMNEVECVTPDTDDFGDYSGSYALNAAAAVYETLQFILDRNHDHVYNIGMYLTDNIDFKIQESEDLTDVQINKHAFANTFPLCEQQPTWLAKAGGRHTGNQT